MKISKIKSLLKLAEVKDCGWWLALQKGINELLHLRLKIPHINEAAPIPSGEYAKGKASVIICTYNRDSLVIDAALALLNQSVDTDLYEIIIVDNNPKGSTLKKEIERIWRESGAYMGYVKEKRLGISYARNNGAKHAKGEYLIFLDDDTIADRYLIGAMLNAFRRRGDAGIIGGQIELSLPDPIPWLYSKSRENIWSGYTTDKKSFYTVKEQYELPYGACLGIRHSVFDALGGFPEDYGRRGGDFGGGEDTALCLRAVRQNISVGIEPKAKVIHQLKKDRFTAEYMKKTIAAGIDTTKKLSDDGYIRTKWTHKYISNRIKIADREIIHLKKYGAEYGRIFKKECEKAAFEEALEC